MRVYELIYSTTKTCQNGNEQTREKKVYIPAEQDGHDVISISGSRYSKAENYLKQQHYYNIWLVDERITELPIVL